MKHITYNVLTILIVGLVSLSITSCKDDDESGGGTPTSGKWYLVTWNGNACDYGEYIFFKGNKLEWNNRMGGENTTYDCRVSENNFYLTNCTDDSKSDISFSIEAYTDTEMVTNSSDNIVRTWKR